MVNSEVYDVTIIGGGPAGLYSAFYSGLREMKTKLIEYNPFLGGKLNVYSEKVIWDIGGLPPTKGSQVITQLVNQAKTFDPAIVLGEKIVSIQKANNIFKLIAESGNIHLSKAIIIAVGSGILKPTKLEVADFEDYESTNLCYKVENLEQFHGKHVVISGGSNSAIDWANTLESIASKVTLVYRGQALRGHEAEVTKLLNSSIECYFNHTIDQLVPTSDSARIKTLILKNHELNAVTELDMDILIVNHGYDRENVLIEEPISGIEIIDNHYFKTDAGCATNISGIYAAGDISLHDGKINLISGALHDALVAVNTAKTYIDPQAESHGMVSSHHDALQARSK
ncbi:MULTISPECIES: NAD(P)/FAD-dependent oxidoreductase [unclassified Enterococcus]|uniref:NAD(P)/FAD-dependent oxidoreductase n=1 Tax=unclassified Enterococcus TaxID=2608891 RepID=UPI0015549A8E|nr:MULTISPECIES: NAD(P)/FAD-dependent oxidoreductase [unclassified Enterococcus]MBS7577369.1 NAD(P)/FAD-dependent oxidoreductase [Enterococcus sp. MMGLQ5-2]MBS7584776.1 NAD(P)/FAD-dependent oxidoreductase [Enterococcus sp. MMGLQ5-1]NPD12631.1 NAD(P)/FAD-dependent oxidoreductase [Enterococcus sp. MMGLQ5-1]NPD37203.1 NAD(P)/FAD-dependent oxidoreductase [Enterococcus sp. MMGLQ5-2]